MATTGNTDNVPLIPRSLEREFRGCVKACQAEVENISPNTRDYYGWLLVEGVFAVDTLRKVWRGTGRFPFSRHALPSENLSVTVFQFMTGDVAPSVRHLVSLEQAWEWLRSRPEVSVLPDFDENHLTASRGTRQNHSCEL